MNQPQQQDPFHFCLDRYVKDIPDFRPKHPTPFENIDGGIGAQGWVSFKFYVLLGFVSNFFMKID